MRGLARVLPVLAALSSAACARRPSDAPPPHARAFMTGVDANYAPELEARGVAYTIAGAQVDVYAALRRVGVDSLRVRVWTGETGASGRAYASEVAKRAQVAGMRPYLVLFLSEDWADYVKQPVPAAWAGLSFDEKRRAVATYCEQTVRSFQEAGVESGLYEIGNEIDFGICGEYEERWEKRFDMAHMRGNVWNRAAGIIASAQDGVRRADPDARFVLHLTQWWNPDFCAAFVDAVTRGGAQVDLVGLSFFPSSGLCKENSFDDLGRCVRTIVERTGRQVLICESAYPSLPSFGGQFASWNRRVSGYPLTEAGQKAWLTDFLAHCRGNDHIAGAFYWSPEWCTAEMWEAFALFRRDGTAKEALAAFGAR